MRTKKFISVVLAGVTAVGLLAGCGSANNTSSAGGGSISSTSTTQTSQSEASETDNTVNTGNRRNSFRRWKDTRCLLFCFRKNERRIGNNRRCRRRRYF